MDGLGEAQARGHLAQEAQQLVSFRRVKADAQSLIVLGRHVGQLAHHLRKLGAGPERRVGISTERSIELVVGILGILKAGAAYVPVDPAYPVERQAFMMRDARVELFLRVGSSSWVKFAEAPVERRIGTRSVQGLLR